MLLYVAYDWVEFEVFFCLGRLGHFEAHGAFTLVVEPQLLAVDVPQEAYLQVVTLSLHTDGHFYALSLETDRDWWGVQHVLHCHQQFDREKPNFTGTVLERYEFLRITTDFSSSVESKAVNHFHLLGRVARADLRTIWVQEGAE